MAGGYKDTADEKRVYVVKASGEIINPNKRSFFRFNQSASLSPGDTIVVPIDTSERKKGLEVLADVSQIIYQLSLGAAAFNSFGIECVEEGCSGVQFCNSQSRDWLFKQCSKQNENMR